MRRLSRSLIGQVVVALAAISLVAVVALSLLMKWQLERVVRAVHGDLLLSLSESILRAAVVDASGAVDMRLPPDLASRFDGAGARFRFLLVDPSGRPIAVSSAGAAAFPAVRSDDGLGTYEHVDRGSELWGLARRVRIGEAAYVLHVAEDMTSAEAILDEITDRAALPIGGVVVAVLAAALIAMLVAVRLSLRPVRMASTQAEQIGPGSSRRAIVVPEIPVEILPLIQAVNGALDRLDEAYRAQREFSADVAHELRTPLSILGAQADLLADRKMAALLRRDIDAMTRLVNQMLDSAAAAQLRIGEAERADLVEIARDVAAMMAPSAIAAGKAVEVVDPGGAVVVRGNVDALTGAVRNLVENALAHTRPRTTVTIRIVEPGTISVADAGSGIPPDQRESIFERYWRSDRRRGGRTGLGLAIVRRVVLAHGGEVAIGDAPEGGAEFRISLPPAPPVAERTIRGGVAAA